MHHRGIEDTEKNQSTFQLDRDINLSSVFSVSLW
jgi:hypothetical protein